jgi:hypothetical protein
MLKNAVVAGSTLNGTLSIYDKETVSFEVYLDVYTIFKVRFKQQ